MQKRKLGLVVLFAALVFAGFNGCQQAPKTQPDDRFDLSKLKTPATYYYQMQDTVQVYGKMKQELNRVSEDGRDLIRIDFDIYGGVSGETELRFDANSGAMVSMLSKQEFRGQTMNNNSYYEDGQVVRIMDTPMKATQDTLHMNVPPHTYDWMQASFLIQTMDLESMIGDTTQMTFYQGFGRAFVDTADVTVVGREAVSVPAGDFDAYRVHLDFHDSQADFFIQADGDGKVLKHIVPSQGGGLATVLIPDSLGMKEE